MPKDYQYVPLPPEFRTTRPVGPVRDQRSEAARPARREVTPLKPSDEQQFQAWVTKNQITDLDHPDSHYDYRGYWKDVAGKGVDQRKQYDDGLHFPDTYKQHGHPTFSVESKYSSGPNDGGAWYGETFIPQRAVGPVRNQQSAPQIVAGLSATRDRLAQQTPTERLLAGMNWTPGPRIGAAPAPPPPTVTLASLDGREPSTLWDRLNAPTVSLPRATTRSIDDAGSDLVRNAGTIGATLRGVLDMGGHAVNTAAGVVEGASSPLSLATMIASLGASQLGKAGLLGVSQGARVLEGALSAPYVGHGLATMAQADTPAEAILGGLETAAGAFGVRQAAKHAFPIPRVAAAYMRERGLPLEMPKLIKKTDERFAMRVADAYEAMQDAPNDPAVARTYAKMAEEASDQFRFIVSRAGVKTEAWRKPKQPYANSAEMLADIEQNNHLWYFPTESGFGQTDTVLATNPLLQPGKSGLPVNDEFRVVHDYFGHGRSRAQFGPVGEENATRTHETMFTPEARDAMITETRGQNSWVNFGPQMRRPDGTLIRKGEPGWLAPAERAYADQRAGILGTVARTPVQALEPGPGHDEGVRQFLGRTVRARKAEKALGTGAGIGRDNALLVVGQEGVGDVANTGILPSTATPAQRTSGSREILQARQDAFGQNAALSRALNGGAEGDAAVTRVRSIAEGGQWTEKLPDGSTVVVNNPLDVSGAIIPRGGAERRKLESAVRAVTDIQAANAGQSAATHVVIDTRASPKRWNMVDIGGGSGGRAIKKAEFDAFTALLPPEWIAVHKQRGLAMLKIDPQTMQPLSVSEQDVQALANAAKNAMPRFAAKGQQVPWRVRGAENTATRGYRSIAENAPPGSGIRTTRVVGPQSDWAKQSAAWKRALDVDVKREAMAILGMVKRTKRVLHPGELNYLEIAARSGATGLARALKDPNQVLPVLAGLGVSGAMLGGVDTESP